MKGQAALLLVLLGLAIVPTLQAASSTLENRNTDAQRTKDKETHGKADGITKKWDTNSTHKVPIKADELTSTTAHPILIDTSQLIAQDMRSSDDNANTEKIQEELARVIKAQAKKTKPIPLRSTSKPSVPTFKDMYNSTDTKGLEAILRHADATDNDDADDEDDDDDLDDADYDDDEDEDEEDEDDDDDDEDYANNADAENADCPDYCRCTGQDTSATTARCSKLLEDQVFGSNVNHLKIEGAGDIRLGPYALRKLNLRMLESVTIVDTKIIELDRTAFEGLSELYTVNLTKNGLTYIHPDTFQKNKQLSLLTIAGNPLRKIGAGDYLLDAPSVTELDLSSNQLLLLPRRAFSKLPNLAYINLKGNRLRSVEKDLFAPLQQLVELDMSHNLLSELPHDLFKGKGLLTLNLASNMLSTLSSVNALQLNMLDLSMNQLKVINKGDLDGIPDLEQLYLSSNNLRKIHHHAFSRLDLLTILDLSNNNLMSLSDQHLRSNSRLQVLLLNNNPDLESLPIFRTNAQEFERYSIYKFECENCGLEFIEAGTFDAMPAMTHLNLARNHLSGLTKGLLKSLSSLRELDLSMNRIDKLEDDIFDGATSLTKLSLAMNSFVSGLHITPFLKTPNLSRLDLSYSGLQKIWSDTSVPFESLRFLSLHKNRLSHVKVEELRAMPKLSGLDISRNPLRCDEELSASIQWLTDHNVTPTESFHFISTGKSHDNYEGYSEVVNQWADLAKRLCDKWDGGPPPRPVPRKNSKKTTPRVEDSSMSLPGPFLKTDILRQFEELDHGQGRNDNDEIDNAWTSQDSEYEELGAADNIRYRQWWYGEAIWPAVTIVLMISGALLITAQIAVCLAKRRGQGPVIRRPLILRPGLVDNKNCGLVYKPLQEEIAAAHQPKRGSFYSSSTFHYDKIVPESV